MEEKKLTVTFVNVGYGEAILLESPDPSKPDGVFTALIDGGSAEDSEFADRSSGRVRIEEYLEKRGIRRLDLAVSTHIHEDHLCGLLRAARIAPPAVLWQTLPPDLYRSLRPLDGSVARNLSENKFMQALNDYGTLCALVEDHGGTILAPKSGQELVIAPDLTVQILSPSTKKQLALADEINAEDFPFVPTGGISAVGCYLNYLETEQTVFLPVFGIEQNAEAETSARQIFHKKIVTVNIREIAQQGGCLNCISWEDHHAQ